MKFGIITPTCNRLDLLARNIKSIQKQDYKNYEHIIVDDSTNNETSEKISLFSQDKRVRYYKNTKNKGVNYSRNYGIQKLSMDVDYVLFLDDDDYLNTYALSKASEVIQKNKYFWYVSNKKGISKILEYDKTYNYFEDYFLGKKIQGDTSHIIKKTALKEIKFSRYIKQAEEWLFFIELGQRYDLYVYDYDTIISSYLPGGLSDRDMERKYKIIFRHIIAVCEFIFFRKINIGFKVHFLKKLYRK